MKKTFDLDSESHWQAYKIANLFLVWKADKLDDKKTAQKIIAHVIKQWYRLGRRHERTNMKVKRLPKPVCGTCDVGLTEDNYGGRVDRNGKIISECKKCYYAKYENFNGMQDQRIAEGIGRTYEFCNTCGGTWDTHVAGGEDHTFVPESQVRKEVRDDDKNKFRPSPQGQAE